VLAGSTAAIGSEPVQAVTPSRVRWSQFRIAHVLLIVVCIGYVGLIAVRTSQSLLPTWDEVVYASQVARDVPAAVYTEPRSRGMSLLMAPIASFTSSIFALRVFLSLLAGVAMYVAFRPWLTALQPHGRKAMLVPAVAAALFASLWSTVLYGTMIYPNLWLAFALVAGAGFYCLAMQRQRPALVVLVAIAASFAIASLLRPTDSVAAAAPLVLVAVVWRTRRWVAPAGAVAGGLVIGWGVWFVEAFVLFDGPFQRLRGGSDLNEGGPTWSLPRHLDAIDGPRLLCRPHEVCEGFWLPASLWWLLLPLTVVVGVLAARRAGWGTPSIVAVACGAGVALQYFVLIDYANARFLQPTYALLAIPAAAVLLWLVAMPSTTRGRVVALSLCGAGLVGHLATQQVSLKDNQDVLLDVSRSLGSAQRILAEEHNVTAPCLVVGQSAVSLGYMLHCRSDHATENTLSGRESLITEAMDAGEDVAVRISADAAVPEFMSDWRRVELPGSSYVAYLPPPATGANQ